MSVHPQVEALLERVARSPLPPYHTVSPFVARRIYRDTRAALAPKAPELPEVRLLAFENFAMRLYRPVVGEILPALVYFHGGGWTIGDLDTHDVLCRELALGGGCAVFFVDYPLSARRSFPGGGGGPPRARALGGRNPRPPERARHRGRRRQRGRQPRRRRLASCARCRRAAARIPAADLSGHRPALRDAVARAQRAGLPAHARCHPLFSAPLSTGRARLARLARLAVAREEPRRPAARVRHYRGLRPAARRRRRLCGQAARGGREDCVPRIRRHGARLR